MRNNPNMPERSERKKYAYWVPWCEDTQDGGYFSYYDSIPELIKEHGSRSPVFRVKHEYVGRYRETTLCKRMKERRKKSE